ncbi:aspartate aminotransferase family protein [Telmatospirillum siberiense]|uniref:Aspartate aminotransferase family protein n=1 Tax=Telmatospirillum siberiense TaxID=382514 RepID=A0A2N3PV57_9PROT|nr:aspartate aminotransferase family protein [Telmatospirillum siberiense]
MSQSPSECFSHALSSLDKADLVTSDRRHLLHPQHHPSDSADPFVWVHGDGVFLTDIDGRRVIDGLSGMWNVSLGHGRRELVDAATRQLSRLAFSTAYAGATHPPAIALADRLAGLVPPSIHAFYFTSGGGEATDSSIRTARYYWRALGKSAKTTVIARELSYHGSTLGAASATGVAEFSEVFGPRLPGFHHIASPYPYRFTSAPGDRRSIGEAAADLLEEAIVRIGPHNVAAFIAEPIQGGGGGIIVPTDDYFPRIRAICDRYDVLLIADEVITGFGRTGRWFGLDHWGVRPDIMQFAKGITSGYIPLGGMGVSERIKSVLDGAPPERRWWHGYTNSAHPVACAVALETIRVLDEEGLVERAARQGARLLQHLRNALADHPNVGDIRGQGLLVGLELVADRPSKERFAASDAIGERVRRELLKRGLYTRVLPDIICLAPPLVTPEQVIDQIADIVVTSIEAVLPR